MHGATSHHVGNGLGVAAWFNPRAKRVNARVVRAFHRALPKARVLIADTPDRARRDAERLAQSPPRLLLLGGGDGTVVTVLNLLREVGLTPFPAIGLFRLGTGNGWPTETGAHSFTETLHYLPRVPLYPPPTRQFDLVEVEGRLCQFAGAGWDALVLHDFRRNLERQQRRLGSRLAATAAKSALGYLYSIATLTVPGELARYRAHGRPRVTIHNLGPPAMMVDSLQRPVPVPGNPRQLFKGLVAIAGAATEPLWGAKFRAFPYATMVPGRINVRVYDRAVLEGVRHTLELWRGEPIPGMHDWFVTRARFTFSREMPCQVGGDPIGLRSRLELGVADEKVHMVDWPRARRLAAGE